MRKTPLQVFLLVLILFVGCESPKSTFEIVELRCEYLKNPIGLDMNSPRFSWKMKKESRGAEQTAYQVMVASTEELLQREEPDLWNSGKVTSDRSIQIDYSGKRLNSGDKAYWKVQIWDEGMVSSGWSSVATFEMGLLNTDDWKAKWIGAPAALSTKVVKLPSPLFRKELAISKRIKTARAYVSGLGYYEFYINGKKIGDHVLSPNQTNYDRRKLEKWGEHRIGNMSTTVLYETFDVTNSLQSGKNALGVILGNGWYLQADRPDDTSLWYDTPRLIAQLMIDYEDGTKEIVSSDETWRVSSGPILYNGLHTGEIYDARLEQKGWNEVGFDQNRWKNAVLVRPPEGKLKSQISPPDRVTKTIRPVTMSRPEKGRCRYDFGQMFSGWVRLKVKGERGSKLNFHFIEELGPGYGQTDTYILKGDSIETWEPRFTWHAFRYVDITGFKDSLMVDALEGRVVNTDVKGAGTFDCSNKLLTKILENYQWTQLGNMHGGVPSDCPHRERRGYTGDGQISAKAAIYNFDLSQFYTKWLGDIFDAQNHGTGYIPNTTPYQDGGGGTAWGSAAIILPWYMYLYYGDRRVLEQHYEGMKYWLTYLKNQLNKEGIIAGQGLGEWVPPEAVRVSADYVNTSYYFHCCLLMANIAEALKIESDRSYYLDQADRLKDNINRKYFNSTNYNFDIGEQGANAIALDFGLVKKEMEDSVFANVVKNVVRNQVHFDTGILGTPVLLDVLTASGRADLAYTLMSQRDYPGFGYMIEKGATTIWETWPGDASHSHPMFGSVCQWFFESLAGISPDPLSPGFKHCIIKPYPVQSLSYVSAVYPSVYGDIKSAWKFSEGNLDMTVTIPANSRATVYVPGDDLKNVTEGEDSKSDKVAVRFVRKVDHYLVFEVASGTYQFHSVGAGKQLSKSILSTPVIYPGDILAKKGDSVWVTISSGVDQSQLFYTTDGKEPDTSSRRLYTSGFYVTEPTTIKAKTYLNGYISSYSKMNRIDFIDPDTNGLAYRYYEGKWRKLPDFAREKVVKSGSVFEFGVDKITPGKDEFALVFDGQIRIEKEGEYTFNVHSNDGSRLYIQNRLVVDNDGSHGADTGKLGKISLAKGVYPIKMQYFQAGGGMFLGVQYAGPGIEMQNLPATILLKSGISSVK